MEKPCDTCQESMREKIEWDEVVCFRKCERFKRWQMLRGTEENET